MAYWVEQSIVNSNIKGSIFFDNLAPRKAKDEGVQFLASVFDDGGDGFKLLHDKLEMIEIAQPIGFAWQF